MLKQFSSSAEACSSDNTFKPIKDKDESFLKKFCLTNQPSLTFTSMYRSRFSFPE